MSKANLRCNFTSSNFIQKKTIKNNKKHNSNSKTKLWQIIQ